MFVGNYKTMQNNSASIEYDKIYRQRKALEFALQNTPANKQYGIQGKINQLTKKLNQLQKQIDNFEFQAR